MDFLDQIAPLVEAEAEPVVAAEVQPTPEVVATPEAIAAPEPITEPAPVQQQDHNIPLPKYLDERERRKEAERRLAEYEAQQAPSQRPDPLDDPEGYAAHFERQMEERLTGQRLQMSNVMARQSYGADAVDMAVNWAAEKAKVDPLFAAAYMGEAHPIDWIVRQHKRDGLLSDIGDNVDDWFTREAAKRGFVSQSAVSVVAPIPVATQPAVRPAAPPRSIASDAAASASVPGDPSADFMAIFNKR